VSTELEMVDGEIPLPRRPGLGIELNREALERFKREADEIGSTVTVG
jgi:L-alanine-DL-glutamate epimerase-like enolase superfamily enzyme